MIPKVIHYCWFGRKPLPELAVKCIDSWKKFLPDYEIKEWNEDNFDINIIPYTAEAYEKGKYAFVSDYARFWILYNYGGVYFDTDVEVIKPMEPIIKMGNFMGTEKDSNNYLVNPGLGMGSIAEEPLYKEVIDSYTKTSFYSGNKLNLTTVVEIVSSILKKHGLSDSPCIQSVANINIFPPDYFSPINYHTGQKEVTTNTVSIHHYAASWVNKYDNLSRFAKMWVFFHLPNTNIRRKLNALISRGNK